MFGKWWKNAGFFTMGTGAPDALAHDVVLPGLDAVDRGLAIDFLCATKSVLSMTARDAALATNFMAPRQYQAGEIVFAEGDGQASNYMLWVLDGEVTVETAAANPRDVIVMTVMEPGGTLGEMGLMDGGRRSVTCTACGTLRCAMLTRQSLKALAAQHPEVAAKLMSIICIGISSRLRDVTDKFKRHVVISNIMLEKHREALPNIRAGRS